LDRDRLLEELNKLKEAMKKENDAIADKNNQLRKRLEQEKKEREALEKHLSKIQEEQGQAVIDLHKRLAKHVRDMTTWKDFQEQDKEYDSADLHITMAEDLAGESFQSKVDTVNDAFAEETAMLENLYVERTGKAPSYANALEVSSPGRGDVSPRKGRGKK